MIVTVDKLIEDFRSDVFDQPDNDDAGQERDTLWSADDVLRYVNSACAQLASDTLALRKLFEFNIEAGNPLVRVPYDEVLEILAINFSVPGLGRRRVLRQFDLGDGLCTDDYGEQVYYSPDFTATGMPTHFTRDYDNKYMRLWKVPYMAGVLQIHAIVMPGELFLGMPLPFSARKDLDLLLMWMKKLAYAKQDADVLDLGRSKAFENEYKLTVLDRRSEVDRARRDGGIVRAA